MTDAPYKSVDGRAFFRLYPEKRRKKIREVLGWKKWEFSHLFNINHPSVARWHRLAKILILI